MGTLLGLLPRKVPRFHKRELSKERPREATAEASPNRRIHFEVRGVGKTSGIPGRESRNPPALSPWPALAGLRRSNERRNPPHLPRPETEGRRSSSRPSNDRQHH